MKSYLCLALIVLAGIVPFSARAVFMDEHIFLQIAENAQRHLLFPEDTPSVFFGIPLKNFAAHTHPPAGEYYLALIYALLGRFSEVPFRLAFAVFSIVAVLAFHFLARRFTEEPFLVAAVFALSPAFFVMTPTLMMDIPMLAFLLLGVALYYAHLEGRRRMLPLAAICFVLAAGAGYTALAPLVCLFIQMLFARRPRKELLAVVAAPAALVLWQAAMTAHFGSIPMSEIVGFYRTQRTTLRHNIGAALSFLGLVALFPWATLFVAGGIGRAAIAFSLIAGLAGGLAIAPWYGFAAASGLILIAGFARAARGIIAEGRNRGEALFILWVPATLLFFIVIADMINARYILLLLPALYLVLLRHSTRRGLLLALIPTAVMSVCIAYADYTFVNSYRSWVNEYIVPLQKQGFRVWSASESGLRFYLQQHGIATLTSEDLRPRGADLVVQHELFRYSLSADVSTMLTPIKRFTLNSSFPLRTFSRAAGAGFHDSRIGLTPFSFSLTPFDEIEISEINPLVAGLPQRGVPAEEVPAWSPGGPILKQSVDLREFKMKIPANSKLEYEIEGQGSAEATGEGIVLRRQSPGTIVWRNLRLVPTWEQ